MGRKSSDQRHLRVSKGRTTIYPVCNSGGHANEADREELASVRYQYHWHDLIIQFQHHFQECNPKRHFHLTTVVYESQSQVANKRRGT